MELNEILQWIAIIVGFVLLFRYRKQTSWIRVREKEKNNLLKWFN